MKIKMIKRVLECVQFVKVKEVTDEIKKLFDQ